jgi:hypothetical protein
MLDFTHVERTLGLPHGSMMLNNADPSVQHLKTHAPGYWVNNAVAAAEFQQLCMDDQIRQEDLMGACEQALADGVIRDNEVFLFKKLVHNDALSKSELAHIVEILTTSRCFKYLVPFINHAEEPEENETKVTAATLRDIMINQAGDGPYPLLVTPQAWRNDAWNLLKAVKAKYSTN